MALAIAILSLLASVAFNVFQYFWRQQDRLERAKEKLADQKDEEQRLAKIQKAEQSPPEFHNIGGDPGPISISRVQHALQGRLMDVWGRVTIVNPTGRPMKIRISRLVLGGEQCPLQGAFFRSNAMERLEGITVVGNHKQDYEIHFMFPDDRYPSKPSRKGELWLTSSNVDGSFCVSVTCP